MSKYQIGDKVKVRSDLCAGTVYGDQIFVLDMKQYYGMELTISYVVSASNYWVEENDWTWTDEMFEGKVKGMFTKKDLETGMLVTCENESKYIVMCGAVRGKEKKDVLINEYGWVDLEVINDKLSCKNDHFDIVKVEKLICPSYSGILKEYYEECFETIWEREKINLTVAIVKYRGSDKSFWFKVPTDIKVQRGQTVLVDTVRGKDTAWVKQVLEFKTQDDLNEYIKNNNVVGPRFPLKKLIGIVRKQ